MAHYLYKNLIESKSPDKDLAGREFVLNIVLLSSIILSGVAFLVILVEYIINPYSYTGINPVIIFSVFLLFSFLLFLSRKNKSIISAFAFVIIFFILAVYASYRSGVDLPEGLLMFAAVIIVSGIVLNAKLSFFLAIFTGILLLSGAVLQNKMFFLPQVSWKTEQLKVADIVVNVATLIFIALVSWLFNIQRERALRRAKESEAALKKQRDRLEETVEKRTRELKLAEAEKFNQLYRFAEFGRLASGLFHDLVNPLNLVSLNLSEIHSKRSNLQSEQEINTMLERAKLGTAQLETFIKAARKQIQNQEVRKTFSLEEEILQVIHVLEYKAKIQGVRITLKSESTARTFGNPIKFNKLIMNLVSNAIEAYEGMKKKDKLIVIEMKSSNSNARISIHDWGCGIRAKDLPRVFEPLFTTKSLERGMGIGLSVCKSIVEQDFKGNISAESTKKGTVFAVTFPIGKAPPNKKRK